MASTNSNSQAPIRRISKLRYIDFNGNFQEVPFKVPVEGRAYLTWEELGFKFPKDSSGVPYVPQNISTVYSYVEVLECGHIMIPKFIMVGSRHRFEKFTKAKMYRRCSKCQNNIPVNMLNTILESTP